MPFKITTCSQFQAKAQEAKRDNKHILINWTSSRCWVCTDIAEPACAKLEDSHPNIVFLDLVHGDFFKAILLLLKPRLLHILIQIMYVP